MSDCIDIVFVHGTGVRSDRFRLLLSAVQGGVDDVFQNTAVFPCFWAPVGGVELQSGGASIPDYVESGGMAKVRPSGDVEPVGDLDERWMMLFVDPLQELREFGYRSVGCGAGTGVVSEWLGSIRLADERLRRFENTTGCGWDRAVGLLARSRAVERLEHSFDGGSMANEVSRAVVRAVLAVGISVGTTSGSDPDFEAVRILELLLRQSAKLEGRGWLKGKATAWALKRATSRFGEEHRGAAMDSMAEFVGDIVRYQAKGHHVRNFIAATIEDVDSSNDVVVVAHSLGGVAAFDLLAESSLPAVKLLVTVGSQAPVLHEMDALSSLDWDEGLPGHFPERWLNVYDRSDPLSFLAEPIFGDDRVRDFETHTTTPFIESHSDYFFGQRQSLWRAVLDALE